MSVRTLCYVWERWARGLMVSVDHVASDRAQDSPLSSRPRARRGC